MIRKTMKINKNYMKGMIINNKIKVKMKINNLSNNNHDICLL